MPIDDFEEWRRQELLKQFANNPTLYQGANKIFDQSLAQKRTAETFEGIINPNAVPNDVPIATTPTAADTTSDPEPQTPTPAPPGPPPPEAPSDLNPAEFSPLFGLDNLVDVWNLIHPDVDLYDWQAEELYRISGYLDGRPNENRVHFYHNNPYFGSYVCANGSGKDMTLIATTAVGLPLLYKDMIVVATSSSYEQLKYQTENHITRAINNLNKRIGGPVYQSVEFYHRIAEKSDAEDRRGGEIKLFATDEAGRAEGWHPMSPTGRLAIIINEAKTIKPPILAAMDRCWGYSHWLEISSPSGRSGIFYKNYKNALKYPNDSVQPYKYFARKVTADDCPHITKQHQDHMVAKHGEQSYIVQTSLRANFCEETTDIIIPLNYIEACDHTPWDREDDIVGIGVDCAAGGDETTVYVRKGNRVIDCFFFREKNTETACDLIDKRLLQHKLKPYIFNIDDGGLGRGFGDKLAKKGWILKRRHNQSAAKNPKRFLNLGAEMWWHVKDLFESLKIIAPNDEVTRTQLSTRKDDVAGGQGKKKLKSKKEMRADGEDSPDRADAFVLCFYSYRPQFDTYQEPDNPEQKHLDEFGPSYTFEQLATILRRNPDYFISGSTSKQKVGDYTILNNNI
jgi:hypothetical protein